MRVWIIILVIIIIILGLAPFIDGYMFKKIYLEQVTALQRQTHNNEMKVAVVDYHLGWMKSTAKMTVTLTRHSNITSYRLQPIVVNIDSTVYHGPFVYNPQAHKYTFAYAVVATNVHLPDVAKVFIPEPSPGFLQIISLVPLAGHTWYNHYLIPPVTIAGKIKWDGLSGNGVIYYAENMPVRFEGSLVIGAVNVPFEPSVPALPQINMQSVNYSLSATRKEPGIWDGKSAMSSAGLLVKWQNGSVINADHFTMQSTYGLTGSNLYSYNETMLLNSLKLPATMPITDISNVRELFVMNNLDAMGMKNYFDFIYTHSESKNNEAEILNTLLKVLTPSSNLHWALSMKTPMGASMADLKFSLQALPKTVNDIHLDLNIDLIARASINLVETVLTNYIKSVTPATPLPTMMNSANQANLNVYKDAVAKELEAHMISLSDSLALIGLQNQNLSEPDFVAKLKAMPQLSPPVVVYLQRSYGQYLMNKQAMLTQQAAHPDDPALQMRKLIDSYLQQGYIEKDNNDYVINFTKRGMVYTLNGKDVSQEVLGMMQTAAASEHPSSTTQAAVPAAAASVSAQATSVLEQIQLITAAADALARQSGSYAVANVSNTTLAPLMSTNPHPYTTPWGTEISVGSPTKTTYVVTIPAVPAAACEYIESMIKGVAHYANLSACNPSGNTNMTYTYIANP